MVILTSAGIINQKIRPRIRKQLMVKFSLTQVIQGPTRLTNTSKITINLIFTNKSDRVTKTFNLIWAL